MRPYSLLLTACLLLPQVGHSQSYREVLICERYAFENLKSQRRSCEGTANTFLCQADAWETYSKSGCTNSTKFSGANMAFILRRINDNFVDFFINKTISEEQFNRTRQVLRESYASGLRRWEESQDAELDSLEAGNVHKRNLNLFFDIINRIGGSSSYNSANNSATFIFNNRVITCTVNNALTVCN